MQNFIIKRKVFQTDDDYKTVADGVQFENGKVVISWRGAFSSIVLWDRIEDAQEVHCKPNVNNGVLTFFEWL